MNDALDALERATGVRLEVVDALAGGEVGATEVRDPDGRCFVIKRWPGDHAAGAAMQARIELVETLRLRRYPAPRYLVAGSFGGDVIAVQAWVDGQQRDDLTAPMVKRLIELALLHGEVHMPGSDVFGTWLTRSLVQGCDGYCLHEPLREHSAQTRMLLDRIRAIGARIAPHLVPSTGVVHRDFHHRNALWQGDDLGRHHRLGGRRCRGGKLSARGLRRYSRPSPPTWPCGRSTGRSATAHRRTSSTGCGSAATHSTGSPPR